MRNKSLLLVIVLNVFLFSSLKLVAQKYDGNLLKQYVLPDITRKSLDFELNSDGNYTKESYEHSDDQEKSFFKGKFLSEFDYLKNTRKFIGTHKGIVNIEGETEKLNSDDRKSRFYPQLGYENTSRFYLNANKLFLETGGHLSFSHSKNNNTTYDYRLTSISMGIPLLVGVGRIENVTDMRQAIYIASSLSKQGLLSQHISNDKMIELAQVISIVKNKRFFDHRKHLKREIGTVDSFLINNDYITESSANYFTTLYDYWLYGGLFERKNGLEFKGGLQPYVRFNTLKRDEKIKTTLTNLSAVLQLQYENAASLYWQHSASVNLYGTLGKEKNTYNSNDQDYDTKYWGVNGGYYLGYYPNSRTNLNVGLHENFNWKKSENDQFATNYERTSVTSFILNVYYYISPQLRLKVEGNMNYHNYSESIMTLKNKWSGDYSLSLTYSLF